MDIELLKPEMKRGLGLMEALELRRSEREFADRMLSLRDLSDLLWAADGENRADGHRTAASALNKMDVSIYVFTQEGAYLYMPERNMLKGVAEGDHRALFRGFQTDFPLAPVTLLMVSNPKKFGEPDAQYAAMMGAVDAGLVSQNIALFCAGNSLVTVPRASMDRGALKQLLGLSADDILVVNNPVGYPV